MLFEDFRILFNCFEKNKIKVANFANLTGICVSGVEMGRFTPCSTFWRRHFL